MYPFLRLALAARAARRAPPLGPFAPHVSRHICWPWDLDPWGELNNGRTLTLYDLGRIPLAIRTGLARVLRAEGWGMTVAGASVRYRRRVRAFDRLTMESRLAGWDARFLYVTQSLWRGDEAAGQVLIRAAITSAAGIVAPARMAERLGLAPESSPLPAWIAAWAEAEARRPWPPARGRGRPTPPA
jgi:acyl-CoA thioesterase FadM